MKPDITKEMVFDHFASKLTPLQRKQIDEWLSSTANEELYYKWLEEWENAHPEYHPDSSRLAEKYVDYIRTTPRARATLPLESSKTYFKKGRRWSLATVAAAVAAFLLLGAGTWLYRDIILYNAYSTGNGETKSFFLADGSQVSLNARSMLRVPRWAFDGENREVYLSGEADFSVAHTADDRKFVVKTEKGFEVVVLGTEFSVFSRQRGARVLLNKGKVQINYREGTSTKQLIMKPGEMLSFDSRNQVSLKQAAVGQNFSLWREKRFVFDETILKDVAQMLEETYGLSVEITSPQLAQRKLMGSFRADNLDELLQTIADLLDISVIRQENSIRLSEKKLNVNP